MQLENYYVPMFGRLFGVQSANIRDLGGRWRGAPTGCGNIGARIDYSSLWGEGGESDNSWSHSIQVELYWSIVRVLVPSLLRQRGTRHGACAHAWRTPRGKEERRTGGACTAQELDDGANLALREDLRIASE